MRPMYEGLVHEPAGLRLPLRGSAGQQGAKGPSVISISLEAVILFAFVLCVYALPSCIDAAWNLLQRTASARQRESEFLLAAQVLSLAETRSGRAKDAGHDLSGISSAGGANG